MSRTVVAEEIALAINTIEAARETHVQWRDYWDALAGHVCDDPTCAAARQERAATAGDREHQQGYIDRYDQVLDVLRRVAP